MKIEIVLCGVGGQGLISTGEIIGEAASLYENKKAVLTSAYGAEARGTFAKSDIILSDREISFPNVVVPDIILCLAQVAYNVYVGEFTDDTIIYYDEDYVVPDLSAKGKHRGFPFHKISVEQGSALVSNTVALGVMIGQTGILKRESVVDTIERRFCGKPNIIKMNVEALDSGLALI